MTFKLYNNKKVLQTYATDFIPSEVSLNLNSIDIKRVASILLS